MAKKIYDEEISRSTDWGGDESTGFLPVSGKRVQEFIKNELNGKAGYFYYDTTANRYIVFANEDTCKKYLENPLDVENQKLVIASFDAPFNYNASIVLNTPFYNAVPLNKKGNYINFTFDITNKSGQPTGESVTCTYTFVRGSIKKVVTEVYRAGQIVNFNVDNYLLEGSNAVSVTITGQTSLAATTVGLTFNVVDLSLTDDFDISTVVRLHEGVDSLEVPYTIKGQGTKLMEWYIDGVKQELVKDEDQIVSAVEETRTKTLLVSGLSSGIHSVQFRASTNISGENFYTETLYREFVVHNGESVNGLIVTACNIPQTFGIVNSENPLVFRGITQYNPYNLQVAGFNTKGLELATEVFIGSTKLGSINISNGVMYSLPINIKTFGDSTLRFVIDESNQREIPVVVEKTTMNISEINDALKFNFNAVGKTNTSTDKESWSYGDYTATLLGFPWNEAGGWVNNRLKLGEGCSIEFTYAPLTSDACVSGRTIELEFNSFNVSDDNEVLCDLRNEDGTGLLITASEISLRSRGGVEINTSYKSDENIRVSLVINRRNGATNKRLVFIYINGIISGAVPYTETDDFISGKPLKFVGTANAGIMIKNIRIYDNALSSDNILNNYIIYQDSIDDMRTIYDRNNIYNAEGTAFDPNLMVNALPVMIVTGELSTLENTTDKDTQIIVDIQYTNLQDPTKSFTMTNAAMRPQGTSSMNYPKKNFRIYTQKVEETELRDYKGTVVENKLYAFKEGSQPVNCWCLKADFAESSGTHNTGIARLWNKVLYNAQIDGLYRLRTTAQQKAIDNSYPFDVRTTVDGFPILLFYRKDYDSDLIFIGKYNFNNDKSTESVFGFEGIEGFDNSRMQCWEVLNNETPLALFTDVSDFDTSWSESFESRYPDTKTPNTTDLKNFAVWMNSMNGKKEQFAEEKRNHFDVYKVAAYYVYITRFAAVDQTVKNSMFTSEDGQHFYFINYDNDTINGLINTGRLSVEPDVTRQSLDSTGKPIYAGYNSVLWNMLEADDEFMEIVQTVDRVLSTTGLSYNEVIDMFDNQQAGKWCERVYNQDAQYKYIGPYVNNGTDNLFMMQGSRTSHRKHWLYRRFAIYDSKFVTGLYRAQTIYFKNNAAPANIEFTITAGTPLYYGYAINNILAQTGEYLEKGESHNFSAVRETTVGDPFTIFGAPNIKGIDISNFAPYLTDVVDLGKVDLPLLEYIKIGNETQVNRSLPSISGLPMAVSLKELDITNMSQFKSIELTNHLYFETLKASGTGLTSLFLTKGSNVSRLELPATMQSLVFENLTKLNWSGIIMPNNLNVSYIKITGCPTLTTNYEYFHNWFTNKRTANKDCTLILDNVDWKGLTPAQLLAFKELGNLSLKGKVTIVENEDVTEYQKELLALRETFGEGIFNKESEFYVIAPASVIVIGKTELLEGESETYECVVFGGTVSKVTYTLSDSKYGTITADGTLNLNYGYTGSPFIRINIVYTTDSGNIKAETKDISITVRARTYPTSPSILGNSVVGDEETYTVSFSNEDQINGEFIGEWQISSEITEYAEIVSQDSRTCKVKKIGEVIYAAGTLTYVIKRAYNNSVITSATYKIEVLNEDIAETDEGVVAAFRTAYPDLIANENYITKNEAALFTAEMLQPGSTSDTSIFASQRYNIKSFEGFKYFTSVTTIPNFTFTFTANLKRINLPESLQSIGEYAFQHSSSLESIKIPNSVKSIGMYAFSHCSLLKTVNLPSGLEQIVKGLFNACTALETIDIPSSVTAIQDSAFSFSGLKEITLPEGLISIGESAFDTSKLESISIPSEVSSIGRYILWSCPINTISVDSRNTYYDSRDECNALIETSTNILKYGSNNTVIPTGVVELSDYAFRGCGPKELVVPESVTSIKEYCFQNSTVEEIKVMGPAKLGNYVFSGAKLIRVELSEGISLVNSIFNGCKNLTYVKLPNDIKTITNSAFKGCTALETIDIPSSVTTIQDSAFSGAGLKEVTLLSNIVVGNSVFSDCLSLETVVIGSGTNVGVSMFSNAPSLKNVILPNDLLKISNYAFFQNSSLEELDIPSSVKVIEDYAFGYCSKLKVNLPQQLTSIGTRAFINCTSLTEAIIPDTCVLAQYVFIGCSALKTVTLPNNVRYTTVGYGTFYQCTALKSITTPSNITKIDDDAFNGCTSLTSVSLNEGLTFIGMSAFKNSGISELITPSTVTIIRRAAFAGSGVTNVVLNEGAVCESECFMNCTKLKTAKLETNQFGSNMFQNCSALHTVELPDDVNDIPLSMFYGCSSLETINIPDSVTSMGQYAFSRTGIKTVNWPSATTTLSSAFKDSNIEELTIPTTVTTISSTALWGCSKLRKIKCYPSIAPTVGTDAFGAINSAYTGLETAKLGTNQLLVPADATGYEEGQWESMLCNPDRCGFTLYKTL